MKTRCLIVDDEPLAIEIIELYLNRLDDFEVVATCNTAIKAFSVLEKETIDLIFLDIQMPQLTGIEFLKSITQKPKVIFTTAYIDYAIESYELDALDYLVKPVSFERFFKAINKYKNTVTPTITPVSTNVKEHIFVKENKKSHKVILDEVLYIESIKDYVRIHLKHKKITVKTTLSDFETTLNDNRFLRKHRSYIVNLTAITAHTANDIEIGEIEIPIGISYKQKVFAVLS
jgi:two-component system LytT family response regulator